MILHNVKKNLEEDRCSQQVLRLRVRNFSFFHLATQTYIIDITLEDKYKDKSKPG